MMIKDRWDVAWNRAHVFWKPAVVLIAAAACWWAYRSHRQAATEGLYAVAAVVFGLCAVGVAVMVHALRRALPAFRATSSVLRDRNPGHEGLRSLDYTECAPDAAETAPAEAENGLSYDHDDDILGDLERNGL